MLTGYPLVNPFILLYPASWVDPQRRLGLLHQPPKGPSSIPPWDRLHGFPFNQQTAPQNRRLRRVKLGEIAAHVFWVQFCIFLCSWGSKRWLFRHPSPTPAIQPGLSRTSRLNKSTFWATCAQHCQSTSLFFKPWLAKLETVDYRFLACQASSTLLSTYCMNHVGFTWFHVLAPGGSNQLLPFPWILSHRRPFFSSSGSDCWLSVQPPGLKQYHTSQPGFINHSNTSNTQHSCTAEIHEAAPVVQAVRHARNCHRQCRSWCVLVAYAAAANPKGVEELLAKSSATHLTRPNGSIYSV